MRNAERLTSKFRIKLQVSKKNSEGLLIALQDAKTGLADHVAMVAKKTALADVPNSKHQDKLSSLHAEFESNRCKSKKKLDDVTTS